MPEDSDAIIQTGARVFVGAVGLTLPAITLAYEAAWPNDWRYLGYTNQPLKVTYKFDTYEVMTEQDENPVKIRRIKSEAMLETTLIEHTGQNLALVLASTATSTAATSTTPGYEEVYLGSDPNLPVVQLGFEGLSIVDEEDETPFPIRGFFWRASSTEGAEMEYAREKETGIPFKFKAQRDPTRPRKQRLGKLIWITAPPTG